MTASELRAESAENLWSIRIELLLRLHKLRNDPQEALRVLDTVEVQTLSERNLSRRLLEVTKQALNVQAADVLQRVANRVKDFKQLGRSQEFIAEAVEKDLNALREDDRIRRREPFQISPLTASNVAPLSDDAKPQ